MYVPGRKEKPRQPTTEILAPQHTHGDACFPCIITNKYICSGRNVSHLLATVIKFSETPKP
jgi:hypothetical protein